MVVIAPSLTGFGLAENWVIEGALTETETFCVTLPPGPSHDKVNVVLEVKDELLSVPEVALTPVQPLEAVQLVAFVVLHVSVVAEL